jgi:hypothetical protein
LKQPSTTRRRKVRQIRMWWIEVDPGNWTGS